MTFGENACRVGDGATPATVGYGTGMHVFPFMLVACRIAVGDYTRQVAEPADGCNFEPTPTSPPVTITYEDSRLLEHDPGAWGIEVYYDWTGASWEGIASTNIEWVDGGGDGITFARTLTPTSDEAYDWTSTEEWTTRRCTRESSGTAVLVAP